MTFWDRKTVLVTGSSGLMGPYVCKRLLEAGANVVGYDSNPKGTLPWHGLVGHLPVMEGSILELESLRRVKGGADIVIHLAAMSNVEKTRAAGLMAYEVNVRGTYMVLEACLRSKGVQAVVAASSNHIYGPQTKYPTTEDAPFNQLDTYSATKAAADILARSYAHNYGLAVAVIRNTNCFGPCDPHDDHLIGGTIKSLLIREKAIIRSKGLTKKAYLHVDDVARAYILAAEWLATKKKSGEAFNVSTSSVAVVSVV